MICLNSAGNLVRFEVGNYKKVASCSSFQGRRLSRRHVEAESESNPSHVQRQYAQRTERDQKRFERGRATKRECGGQPTRAARASGQLEPATVAGPPSLHLEPRSRLTTATTVQCAGKSLRRWVELCRPSNGRGQRTDPWPQYAFKVSMFNVSCNSH